MNKFTGNLAVALAAAGSTLSAAELTLTGAAPGVWDFATSCWTNSAGAYRAFADGDDALIDDSVFTGGKITFDARVTPESVTFDLANDLVLTNSAYNYGFGWDLKQWTKKGVGTLIVSTYDGRTSTSANGNLNTGRIDVVAGTLKNGNTSLNMFGSMNYGYDLFVHPGATYWSATHHGSYTGAAKCGPRITVETNGTFKITGVLTFAKTLALNGGNIDWSAGLSMYGPLAIHEKLVIGPQPQPFVVQWPADDPAYFGIGVNGTNGNSLVIQVADITGDANPDAIFSNYFMRVTTDNTNGWRKTGPGYMVYAPKKLSSNGKKYTINGDIRVDDGILELARPAAVRLDQPNEVYVAPGAELRVSKGRALYSVNYQDWTAGYADEHLVRVTVDHGTLVLSDQDLASEFDQRNCDFACGYLTLDHATFDYSNLFGSSAGILMQLGGLKYLDDHPREFIIHPGNLTARATIRLYDSHLTEIYVGATDGADYDLSIAMPLRDACRGQDINKPSGFSKTGPGRLRLNYRVNADTCNKFSGDAEVREGELIVGSNSQYAPASSDRTSTFFGDISGANGRRTFTVWTNGTLHVNARFTIGRINTITNDLHALDFAIRGGTLKTDANNVMMFANLAIDGGAFEFGDVTGYDFPAIQVAGTLTVEGETAAELPGNGNLRMFGLNGYPETVMDVGDVTSSAAPDLTIGMPLIHAATAMDADGTVTNGWQYGFTKRGAGTLRLTAGLVKTYNSPSRYINYNGDTKVESGALQADGDLSRSDTIRVSSGATLAGTGTVNNVVLAAGAGLRFEAGLKKALTVKGDLTLPETGALYIDTDSPDDAQLIKEKFLEVEGTLTAPDAFEVWDVYLNGQPAPAGFKLLRRDNALIGGYMRGTTLTVR